MKKKRTSYREQRSGEELCALIYARVSSRKQVTEGHGLSSQETRCREFAANQGWPVEACFHDDITGKSVIRRGMSAMLDYLRSHPQGKFVVIIDDVSRLGRERTAYWELRGAISAMGARLVSPNMTFGDDPESDFREGIQVEFSQLEMRNNAKRTVNRMKARLQNGYSVTRAPVGYLYAKRPGHGKLLVPDENLAPIVKAAFEGYENGRFETVVEVRRFLEAQPAWPKDKRGEVHQERVNEMLPRVIYAGYLTAEQWGIQLVPAKHEPLISLETWQNVQKRHRGMAKAPAYKSLRDDFPLRGFVCCADCGQALTACWSKGRSSSYAYYLCDTRGCPSARKSIRRELIEGDFERLLAELCPSEGLLNLAFQMIRDLWDMKAKASLHQTETLRAQVAEVEKEIDGLLSRVVSAKNSTVIAVYERKVEELVLHKAVLAERVVKSGKPIRSFNETYRTALDFLANPSKLWHSPRLEDRRAVLKMVFADVRPK